jgi:hypothetical protein
LNPALISALVAAVVTLGIEYFAKPSLEVRKDRIVDQHRTRREVLRSYNKLVFDVARLTVQLREEGAPVTYRHSQVAELNDLIREESKRLRSLVAAGGRELRDLEEAGVFLFGSALQGYVAVLARHGDDDPTGWIYVLELLDPLTDLVEQALATPRWRWRLRQRRIRAVQEFSPPI